MLLSSPTQQLDLSWNSRDWKRTSWARGGGRHSVLGPLTEMQEGGNNFEHFAGETHSAQEQIGGEDESLDMPGLVESVMSSPNLRDMAAEGPPSSPADKKRNKLGYHRTAVACGQSSYRFAPMQLFC